MIFSLFDIFLLGAGNPNSSDSHRYECVFLDSLARQLCQHIIGMNPLSVGNINDTSSWPRSKKENIPASEHEKSELDEGVKEDENWSHLGEDKSDSDSSNELIHQPFLLNTEILVRDLLLQT